MLKTKKKKQFFVSLNMLCKESRTILDYALWFEKCFPFDGGKYFKGKRTTGENAMTGHGKVGWTSDWMI